MLGRAMLQGQKTTFTITPSFGRNFHQGPKVHALGISFVSIPMRDYHFMRGTLTVAKTLAVLALVAIGFTFWAGAPRSPDLQPDRAAALIAARPEFNRYATLLAVSQTTRGAGSMNTCCYSAAFTFRQNGSTDIIDARAEFHYTGDKWHLATFWWGKRPHVQSVDVGSDSDASRR